MVVKKDDKTKAKKQQPPIEVGSETAGYWDYYSVMFRLRRTMLGTCTEASIMQEHVIQKARKQIKKANRLSDRIVKSLDKFKGDSIPAEKEIEEVKKIIMAFAELTARPVSTDLPDDLPALLKIAAEVKKAYDELVAKGEQAKFTVFMKEPKNGNPDELWPVISSHMVLGNFKENLKIITNNGDKTILSTKVSIGETMALDVKAVEEFMTPDMDIMRHPDGKPLIEERPITFNRMGKTETAIAASEQLPKGATFECKLRIRKGSPINMDALKKLLTCGKNNGLGANRGAGNFGSYDFNLKHLPNFVETVEGHEDGWR